MSTVFPVHSASRTTTGMEPSVGTLSRHSKAHGSSAIAYVQQRVIDLGTNARAFGQGVQQSVLEHFPSLQTALKIPERLAFHAAEAIAGPIEPKTAYQAQLKNSPSAASLVAQSGREFIADSANLVKGAAETVDMALYAGVTRLASIEARTPEQKAQVQKIQKIDAALSALAWGQTPSGARWAEFNPLLENIPAAASLGAAFAGVLSHKSFAYGPLQWVGNKTTAAHIFENKDKIEIVLGKKRMTYDIKAEELTIPNMRWPAAEVNTVGAILNGRGLDVGSVKGQVNLHQVSRGSGAWPTLGNSDLLGQKLLRAVGEKKDLRHGNFLVLADLHEHLQRLPAGQLISPFYVQDLKFVGKSGTGKTIEIDMNRLRPGVSPDNVYFNMYVGDKFVSESMHDVLTQFTNSILKAGPHF